MSPEFVFDLALKSTAIFVIGWVVTKVMYRASSASRHAVWAAVCVAALVLPAAQVALPTTGVSWWPQLSALMSGRDAAVDGQVSTTSTITAGLPALSSDASVASTTWTPGWLLGVMWAMGLLVGVARFVSARRAAFRLTATTTLVIHEGLCRRAELIAAWLGVARYELRSGPSDLMPATWGMRTPVVVLPSVATTWPLTRLDPVLVHELAHVQRRDAVWLQLAQVMLAVWWMHPMAWVAARPRPLPASSYCAVNSSRRPSRSWR